MISYLLINLLQHNKDHPKTKRVFPKLYPSGQWPAYWGINTFKTGLFHEPLDSFDRCKFYGTSVVEKTIWTNIGQRYNRIVKGQTFQESRGGPPRLLSSESPQVSEDLPHPHSELGERRRRRVQERCDRPRTRSSRIRRRETRKRISETEGSWATNYDYSGQSVHSPSLKSGGTIGRTLPWKAWTLNPGLRNRV